MSKEIHIHEDSVVEKVVASVEPVISLTNILLIVIIVLNATGLYLLSGNSISLDDGTFASIGLKKAILEVEYEKVGGKESFEIQSQAQKLSLRDPQNPGNIEGMKKYISSFQDQSGTAEVTTSIDTFKIATGSIQANIVKDAVVEGNPEAVITVTEYSDMECPFCMKQFHDTRLKEKLLAQYGDKLNFVFKNSRGVNHKGTTQKAIAALCIQKVGGAVPYVQYYTSIMEGSTGNNNLFPVSLLGDLAKKIGVDFEAWNTCYTSQETASIFEQQTAEAISYNLSGTPGTRIVNNKTGKAEIVEGAFPYETFTQKIDLLLK